MTNEGPETADPSTGLPDRAAPADDVLVFSVLSHPDLSRVGERAIFPVDATSARGIVIGRDEPLFAAAPLADPCVSRRQVRVRWLAQQQRFFVEPEEGARRSLRLLREDGELIEEPPAVVSAGTLLAIGDRVLLGLECFPSALASAFGPGDWGNSRAATLLRARVRTLAPGTDSVLIQGETGSGKELVARELHDSSERRDHPFVVVNCAALPEALIESELFGHARGAFSGALQPKPGIFRAAGSGTVFLDEIGELPAAVQAKLLRALEQRTVRPLGEPNEQPFAARVVAATNRDLRADAATGRFRADLFARLEAPAVLVPPLRERRSDIPFLFVRFLRRRVDPNDDRGLGRLWRAPDTRSPPLPMRFFLELLAREWPRNVRELDKFAAETAASNQHAGGFTEPVWDAAPERDRDVPGRSAAPPTRVSRPDAHELTRVLEQHDFVQQRAARALGVSRTTLDKWMHDLDLRGPKDLTWDEVERALAASGGALEAAARALGVSARGLRLRMTELGVASR